MKVFSSDKVAPLPIIQVKDQSPSTLSSTTATPVHSPEVLRKCLRTPSTVSSLDPNHLVDPTSSASSSPKASTSKSVRFSFTAPTVIPIEYNNIPRLQQRSCKKPNHRCARIVAGCILTATIICFLLVLSFHFGHKA